jgi:hypothetical protein
MLRKTNKRLNDLGNILEILWGDGAGQTDTQ